MKEYYVRVTGNKGDITDIVEAENKEQAIEMVMADARTKKVVGRVTKIWSKEI